MLPVDSTIIEKAGINGVYLCYIFNGFCDYRRQKKWTANILSVGFFR